MKVDEIKVEDVIQYIESRHVAEFPHRLLQEKGYEAILAGGSVANAVLSIMSGKEYPVRDLDCYVFTAAVSIEPLAPDWNIVENENEYVPIGSNGLQLLRREEKDGLDIIYMSPLNDFFTGNFAESVLMGFDLNCVQIGMTYNSSKQCYELVMFPEFVDFLKTRQVNIVNVHSQVTLYRAVKKTRDLNAFIDLETETNIMRYCCNPEKLSPLSDEQAEKHKDVVKEVSQYLLRIQKAPIGEKYYELFNQTEIMAERYLKIKILRLLIDNRYSQGIKHRLEAIPIERGNLIRQCIHSGYTLEDWLGTKDYPKGLLHQVDEFVGMHPDLEHLFVNKLLDEIVEFYYILRRYQKKYSPVVIGYIENVLTETQGLTFRQLLATALWRWRKDRKVLQTSFFGDKYKSFPSCVVNEVYISELKSPLELMEEGEVMHHCVGGYSDSVKNGKSRIFRLRHVVSGERGTLQLKIREPLKFVSNWSDGGKYNWNLSKVEAATDDVKLRYGQLRGVTNSRVSKEMETSARMFIEQLNKLPDLKDYLLPVTNTRNIFGVPHVPINLTDAVLNEWPMYERIFEQNVRGRVLGRVEL